MRSVFRLLLGTVLSFGWMGTCAAQTPKIYIYPDRGQSEQQQEQDKIACHDWAVQKTGVDPLQATSAPSPAAQPQKPQAAMARGAAQGALLGTGTGAITGNVGTGAAVGAGAGLLRTGRSQRRAQAEKAQQQQALQVSKQADMKEFGRAFSACLEGRGYTVR
ncbi:hypothetical protein [Gloeobacter morelensis]|uniref:YMGG-like Gly-zipper domain-containing protein n=1 Tax=Gloeobacter morelensis MG652769 TaxID=2781736 RepID=A0ABY3PRY0_9CYAN|nr:hypothetical protein [Gloeobacter morelensis]UFP96202.1 hypothetical protein ISF26_08350 [Gloeobacter morelensis MG652769]